MLLLLDLDNTLVDRYGAFAAWAEEFIAAHRGTSEDLGWLLETDGHGGDSINPAVATSSARRSSSGIDGVRYSTH